MQAARVVSQLHAGVRRFGAAASSIVMAAAWPVSLAAAESQTQASDPLCTSAVAKPAGTVGKFRNLSTPFPEPASPLPTGAPNVLIWLMDDVGFGQLSPFGGLIPMPVLDQLARNGLRYTNFHATPLCSPSRAALLTGRNSHAVHMGSHATTAMPYPGYDGKVPKSAATTAQVLHDVGYATIALGKWDHVPTQFISPAGPFDLWPTGQGFDHFYGFMSYETDNFSPTLWRDHTPQLQAKFPANYHLTTDLADQAIGFVDGLRATGIAKPFYLYWATGAAHAPHHAPLEWRLRFRGRFDMGWDVYRQEVFARQKQMGVIPSYAKLPPRPPELPAWTSLSPAERRLYAREMEAFAAQIAHADSEFGRILEFLRQTHELDNTIVIVASDNGASAEGGLAGLHSATSLINGRLGSFAENEPYYEDWGGPATAPHYHAGWAFAGNTPFRYYKQSAHEGGQHVPLLISWPRQIRNAGGFRTQYHHIIDISPTLLAAVGVSPPACVNGALQQPIDGIAMNYTFDADGAAGRRTRQYYELFGNRGIYADGWSAVVGHKVRPWELRIKGDFATDKWELYDLSRDPTQTRDLAAQNPRKVAEMEAIFDAEAKRFNVFPLDDDLATRIAKPSPLTHFEYRMPGSEGFVERFGPPLFRRDYQIEVKLDAAPAANGVLVAEGGSEAGYVLYAKDARLIYEYHDMDGKRYTIAADRPLERGESTVGLRFTRDAGGDGAGVAELLINGATVAHGRMHQGVVASYSASELFNVGLDSGAAAGTGYEAPYPFNGRIERVTVDLGAIQP